MSDRPVNLLSLGKSGCIFPLSPRGHRKRLIGSIEQMEEAFVGYRSSVYCRLSWND